VRCFLCYDRDDVPFLAGRLCKRIQSVCEPFLDVRSISVGDDYLEAIVEAILGHCGAFLVLIGPRWKPSEDIAYEINLAWKAQVPVIPVLLDGARMPRSNDLPPNIARLSFLHAIEITNSHWDYDTDMLCKNLTKISATRAGSSSRGSNGQHSSQEVHAQ